MRFVFASDSLKGTISSARAAAILEEEAARAFPNVACTRLAVADGGEGTVDAVVASLGGALIEATVSDPLGRPVEATYGMLPGNRAIIEMAAASGLPLLTHAERNPLLTSTYGTGQLVLHALSNGATEVTIAIGGSATNDGGMGAMRALGVRFLDSAKGELEGTGADLARVSSIDTSGLDPLVSHARFRLLCDVDNPLLGPRGATRVFAPQKGANPQQIEELEHGMASFARVLERTLGHSADQPGDGAAGALVRRYASSSAPRRFQESIGFLMLWGLTRHFSAQISVSRARDTPMRSRLTARWSRAWHRAASGWACPA